jgi:hypothetical protein
VEENKMMMARAVKPGTAPTTTAKNAAPKAAAK